MISDGLVPESTEYLKHTKTMQQSTERDVVEEAGVWLSVNPNTPDFLLDFENFGIRFGKILVSDHDISGNIALH